LPYHPAVAHGHPGAAGLGIAVGLDLDERH
jgi:hypothetical protein